MLRLSNIKKIYTTGDSDVTALDGINIEFRQNEFISILGPSGCGKTTLLNIIGGLDQYTSGDLIINGKSTKNFTDGDWDAYRNRSIGFVFQSYNLIPHQTVLANVELAMTLSGVSRTERAKRAKDALKKVGLENQMNKKPNQLSGGQMQRVAIARALVNNPDILLADEPTGALDSATSIQIMDLLKEIARDRLVVMVTHNPELAEQYSTRIVKLIDGKVISDSDPYTAPVEKNSDSKKKKKPSMNFFTALSLSFNNLMTKRTRTLLTSFAGSIGIIGIALILSLSSGVSAYINTVEENALSSYPITIQRMTMDMSSTLASMMEMNSETPEKYPDTNVIHTGDVMNRFITTTMSSVTENDLAAFKKYIENEGSEIASLANDIKYGYSTTLNIYKSTADGSIYKVNPSTVFENIGMGHMSEMSGSSMSGMYSSAMNVWRELLDNEELFDNQYSVIAGKKPTAYNEVVLAVDEYNRIGDYTLYALGLLDIDELKQAMSDAMQGKEVSSGATRDFTFDELLGLEFKLLINSDYFEKDGDVWADRSSDNEYIKKALDEKATTIKVVGIVRPTDGDTVNVGMGYVGYLPSLTQYLINEVNESEVVKAQKADPDVDIFTGIAFNQDETVLTMEDIQKYISTLGEEEAAGMNGYIETMRSSGMSDDQIVSMMAASIPKPSTDATYSGNLSKLGVSDPDDPSSINIYAKDFKSKERITALIDEYNEKVGSDNALKYTDYIGMLLSSVTIIINAISYVLIAFVSISLVVSSIMIGIITYISVLERTKEIGILRAIGASKRDISRVFNAETITIGFCAGALGIGISLLLTIPINIIIENLSGIGGLCSLPPLGAVILVSISVLLTFIAGLIPSRIAAKKDPVVALRTE